MGVNRLRPFEPIFLSKTLSVLHAHRLLNIRVLELWWKRGEFTLTSTSRFVILHLYPLRNFLGGGPTFSDEEHCAGGGICLDVLTWILPATQYRMPSSECTLLMAFAIGKSSATDVVTGSLSSCRLRGDIGAVNSIVASSRMSPVGGDSSVAPDGSSSRLPTSSMSLWLYLEPCLIKLRTLIQWERGIGSLFRCRRGWILPESCG